MTGRALRIAISTRRLLAACIAFALLFGALDLGHLLQPRHEHASPAVTSVASDHRDTSSERDVAAVLDHHCHGCVQLGEPTGARESGLAIFAASHGEAVSPVLHGRLPPAPARPPRSSVLT
jgi:hypothetical protein